jgi:hypothetical protein
LKVLFEIDAQNAVLQVSKYESMSKQALFAIIAYWLATSLLSITAFTHRTEIQAYLLI